MRKLKKLRRTLACLFALPALVLTGCGANEANQIASGQEPASDGVKIAMIPKFTSDPYFVAAGDGAKEAADELGLELVYNGPVNADVAAQSNLIDQYVEQGFDMIAVSANDPDALAPALLRARERGVTVTTWDADVAPEARSVFLNQVTFEGFGRALVDMMVEEAGPEGRFLIVTAVLTAPNQNRWIEEMRSYIESDYPGMDIVDILPGDEDLAKSREVTLNFLQADPDIDGVWAVTGIATPGIAEAVEQLGLAGEVAVTGLGVPSLIRPYIENGTLNQAALWNPVDIGYAAVHIAAAEHAGALDRETAFTAGRLGTLEWLSDDTILLGPPYIFTKDNVDEFDF